MMRLEKYQGLGNDFLILLDDEGTRPVDEATARALCDRHLGVGAHGVIRATRADVATGAHAAMMPASRKKITWGMERRSGERVRSRERRKSKPIIRS